MESSSLTPPTAVSLKLLIDPKRQRVVFAEANNDCVEFLFSLLSLPLVSMASFLFSADPSLNSSNVDVSLRTLFSSFMNHSSQDPGQLPIPEANFFSEKLEEMYLCEVCRENTVGVVDSICHVCNIPVSKRLPVFAPYDKEKYVKAGTYMVMDDLEITPMSTTAVLGELKKFNSKQIGDLEEKVVQLDMCQGMELLRASLTSKSVLTDLYVDKKGSLVAASVEAILKISSSISNMILAWLKKFSFRPSVIGYFILILLTCCSVSDTLFPVKK